MDLTPELEKAGKEIADRLSELGPDAWNQAEIEDGYVSVPGCNSPLLRDRLIATRRVVYSKTLEDQGPSKWDELFTQLDEWLVRISSVEPESDGESVPEESPVNHADSAEQPKQDLRKLGITKRPSSPPVWEWTSKTSAPRPKPKRARVKWHPDRRYLRFLEDIHNERLVANREVQNLLASALDLIEFDGCLNEKERLAILGHWRDGKTLMQIEAEVGISKSHVENLVMSAQGKMIKRLRSAPVQSRGFEDLLGRLHEFLPYEEPEEGDDLSALDIGEVSYDDLHGSSEKASGEGPSHDHYGEDDEP